MPALLFCDSNTTKQQWMLCEGQHARVGSSVWVEFAVHGDLQLAPEHFVIRSDESIRVTALAPIRVNGKETDSAILDSQSVMEAGTSRFHIVFSSSRRVFDSTDAGTSQAEPTKPSNPTWLQREQHVSDAKLSAQALRCISEATNNCEATELLFRHGLFTDCLRLIAACLLPYQAIAWCANSLQTLASPDMATEPRVLVEQWLIDPSEAHRHSIASSRWLDQRNEPWMWVLEAIARTNGLWIQENCPPVPIPSGYLGNAVFTALQLAVTRQTNSAFRDHCCATGITRLQQARVTEGEGTP